MFGNYLNTGYLHTYSRASFHRSGVNSLRARSALVLHEQTGIAATRPVWSAVILNKLAMYIKCVYLNCVTIDLSFEQIR